MKALATLCLYPRQCCVPHLARLKLSLVLLVSTFIFSGLAQESGNYGTLAAGSAISNTIAAASGDRLSYHTYFLEVPAGTTQLLIHLTDNGQDLDLAAKAGAEITDYESDVDAIDVSETANPVLRIDNPRAGTWYLDVINFYEASASYQLQLEVVSAQAASSTTASTATGDADALFETVSSAMQEVAAYNDQLNEQLVSIVNNAGMMQQNFQLAYDESLTAQTIAEELYNFFTELRALAESSYQDSPAQSDNSNIAIFLINLAVEGQNAMAAWYDWLDQLQQALQTADMNRINLVLDVPLSTAIFQAERYEAWYKVFTGESSFAELEQFLSSHQQAPSYLATTQSSLVGGSYTGYDDALMFGLQNQMMDTMHDTSMSIIAAMGGGCYGVDTNNDGICD